MKSSSLNENSFFIDSALLRVGVWHYSFTSSSPAFITSLFDCKTFALLGKFKT
jgi:hypothetical protein